MSNNPSKKPGIHGKVGVRQTSEAIIKKLHPHGIPQPRQHGQHPGFGGWLSDLPKSKQRD